jgi:hypothetical protein
VSGDGKPDVVVASQGAVSVLAGNGDGTFSTTTDYALGFVPSSLAVSDVNGE